MRSSSSQPGTGKSHFAQAIGRAFIQAQAHRILYREARQLPEDLADATVAGERKQLFANLATFALLTIDDLGMRKLPATAAEDSELVIRHVEPPRRGLGQAPRRHRCRRRDARPTSPSRPRPQIWCEELADEDLRLEQK